MIKLLLTITLSFGVFVASKKPSTETPIRKSLTDEIKKKTKLWVPFEPEENPLAGMTTD